MVTGVFSFFNESSVRLSKMCPKIIVPRLCAYCGGAVDSLISISTQLHWSGFNLDIEILFESIRHVVADVRQRKGKINGCFKNSTLIVLHQCQNEISLKERTLASY